MKTVRVTFLLQLNDDQPVADWIVAAIEAELETGEEVLEYTDDEPTT